MPPRGGASTVIRAPPGACGSRGPARARSRPRRRCVRWPPSTTIRPPTTSVSTIGRGPSTSAATGSAMPAWSMSSSRHSATSASLPGSSEPISASRPRQRAPWMVPSVSASRAVSACGPPAARAISSDWRSSPASSPASFDAGPSTPRPTGAPAAVSAATGAMPAPSRALEDGQWATPVPVSPKRRTSRSSRCTQWASHTSSPSQPSSSRYSTGRTPNSSRQNASSSSVSAMWVCSRTPRSRAKAAVSAISSLVTLNGEHGARAMRTIASGDGSWNRSIASAQAVRIASRSSVTSSGGSPPCERPRSIEPRQGWKRAYSSLATSISTASRSPASRGKT